MLLDASSINTRRYKLQIKDKWSNPGKWVATPGHIGVVASEKEAFGLPSTTVSQPNIYIYIYIYIIIIIIIIIIIKLIGQQMNLMFVEFRFLEIYFICVQDFIVIVRSLIMVWADFWGFIVAKLKILR